MQKTHSIFHIVCRMVMAALFLGGIITICSSGYFWVRIKPGWGSVIGCFLLLAGVEIATILSKDKIFHILSVSMFFVWILAWMSILDHSRPLFSEKAMAIIILLVSTSHLILCMIKNRETVLRVLAVVQYLFILGACFAMFVVFSNQGLVRIVEKEIPSYNGELSIRVEEVDDIFDDDETYVYVHPNYQIDLGLVLVEPQGDLVYSTHAPHQVSTVQWESDDQISINGELYDRIGDTYCFEQQEDAEVSIPQ